MVANSAPMVLAHTSPENAMQLVTNKSKEYPDFLEKRIVAFKDDRMGKQWGGEHIMRGKVSPDQSSIELISNDYLALSTESEIHKAQSDSLLRNGNGVLMSGIFMRGETVQNRFEKSMANFMQSSRAILCQSGWKANVGLIQSIADETVPIYIDMLAHMSIWEGIHSAKANVRAFRHNDLNDLETKIRKYGPGVIAIDSVYSTNGSIAPISEIVSLGQQFNCILLVDESHSLGTHGPQGSGLVVKLGLADKVHFRTASLAKAFAGRAGIITCSEQFYDYFAFTSRPAIFSSMLLPHEVVGLQKTLDIIKTADKKRYRLHRNAEKIRNAISNLGYNVDASDSQIVSIEPGIERKTMEVRDALADHGIFGAIFCAPATAKNRSLIRMSVHSDLSSTDIYRIIEGFRAIRDRVGLTEWRSTKRKIPLSPNIQNYA